VTHPRRVALLVAVAACGGAAPDAPVEPVLLPHGATFGQMTDSLVAHRIVTNRWVFTWLAKLGRFDRRLKAGYYEIRQGESPLEVLRMVAAGKEKRFRLTIPEGFTLLDIARLAEQTTGLPADSVLRAARDTTLLRAFQVDGESFEGYLLPETYFVSKLVSAEQLIRELADGFRKSWNPAWEAKREASGLSRRELVTLASIVEAEARAEGDRPLVAAVYRNRLRLGMPLQADPTVQYALQETTGKRKTRLLYRDYRVPSRFNTYLYRGLPPGPIGAPSIKSIEAVLDPAPVPYLYFVAGLDGTHVFSRTYGEHLRAIARIRAEERRARLQSTPSRP
jgi:UPF0755 protein